MNNYSGCVSKLGRNNYSEGMRSACIVKTKDLIVRLSLEFNAAINPDSTFHGSTETIDIDQSNFHLIFISHVPS